MSRNSFCVTIHLPRRRRRRNFRLRPPIHPCPSRLPRPPAPPPRPPPPPPPAPRPPPPPPPPRPPPNVVPPPPPHPPKNMGKKQPPHPPRRRPRRSSGRITKMKKRKAIDGKNMSASGNFDDRARRGRAEDAIVVVLTKFGSIFFAISSIAAFSPPA